MKRLPKSVLNEIEKVFLSEKNINKRYNLINIIFKNNDFEPYDINNLLKKKKNKCIAKLNKLLKERNKNIIRKMCKTTKWNKFLKNLKKELYIDKNINVNSKDIRDGIFNVLKKYNNNWSGYWSMIYVSDSGIIKNIQLFDIGDCKLFYKYLKSKNYTF